MFQYIHVLYIMSDFRYKVKSLQFKYQTEKKRNIYSDIYPAATPAPIKGISSEVSAPRPAANTADLWHHLAPNETVSVPGTGPGSSSSQTLTPRPPLPAVPRRSFDALPFVIVILLLVPCDFSFAESLQISVSTWSIWPALFTLGRPGQTADRADRHTTNQQTNRQHFHGTGPM